MKKKITLVLVLTFIVSALLMACGSSKKKTLEEIINSDAKIMTDMNAQLQSVVAQSQGVYKDITVSVSGNTMKTVYYINDIGAPDDQLKQLLDEQDKSGTNDQAKKMMVDELKGYDDVDADAIKLEITFISSTGATVFSKTY